MSVIVKYRVILYCCVPLFLILALYSQLQSVKVRDMSDSLSDKLPTSVYTQDVAGINTLVIMIPAIGPYLEVNSVTSLFKDMKYLLDNFSEDNTSRIFKEMMKEYEQELNISGDPLYLYNYNSTVRSMITYFENYSSLGAESKVTADSKVLLSKNLSLLQLISVFKIICYIILFILGVIGFFVFKGRYAEKESFK